MSHFMFYSGRAYMYKMQKEQAQRIINSKGFAFYPVEDQTHFLKQSLISPQGEAIQEGYLQERFDGITAPHDSSGLNVPPVSLSNVPGISESNVPPIAKTNVPGVSL